MMLRKIPTLAYFIFYLSHASICQDTFSIVAIDSITGEVGSAGASCVDLFQTSLNTDDFIGVLIPGVGAINSQAYYIPANQNNATIRLNAGDTPDEIIDHLINNDIQGTPERRQYGVAAFVNGSPQTAAHTGADTDAYTGHILGPDYAIQGNILSGQAILDSMEARFLRSPGDLACRLMAALQGANTIGADSRCAPNGSSSLFAYVKVAQLSDEIGSPSMVVGIRTRSNAGIEPIDSLQSKFDAVHSCDISDVNETPDFDAYFSVYPNPVKDLLSIDIKKKGTYDLELIELTGKIVLTSEIKDNAVLDISSFGPGSYILKINGEQKSFVKTIILY